MFQYNRIEVGKIDYSRGQLITITDFGKDDEIKNVCDKLKAQKLDFSEIVIKNVKFKIKFKFKIFLLKFQTATFLIFKAQQFFRKFYKTNLTTTHSFDEVLSNIRGSLKRKRRYYKRLKM